MRRVLILGNCPLPNENTKTRPAAGLRTWQFVKALAGKAEVTLVTIAMPECYEKEVETRTEELTIPDQISNLDPKGTATASRTIPRLIISKNDPHLIKEIQAFHDSFQPEAIISVNTYPSFITAQVKSLAPLWADLNGWIMAEAQAQAFKMESNDYIPHYRRMEEMILKNADKFSTVSFAQKFAVMGELGILGRLNKESFGYEFVNNIPNATEWFPGEKKALEDESAGPADLFSHIPPDAAVLLFMGGYNTWVDEINLFKGVEEAMSKCEKLYFVSTGGDINGLDNKTFAKFKTLVDESSFKERFVFLGWVDTKNIPYIYKRADMGINVDRKCAETFTGARNRINEMMKFGLPVITTRGSEISYEVERVGAGMAIESGKHEVLAEAIVEMYEMTRHRSGRYKQFQENGIKYMEELNYEKTLSPLLQWVSSPGPAPDRGVVVGKSVLKAGMKYLKENGVKKFLKKILPQG